MHITPTYYCYFLCNWNSRLFFLENYEMQIKKGLSFVGLSFEVNEIMYCSLLKKLILRIEWLWCSSKWRKLIATKIVSYNVDIDITRFRSIINIVLTKFYSISHFINILFLTNIDDCWPKITPPNTKFISYYTLSKNDKIPFFWHINSFYCSGILFLLKPFLWFL